jgi:hypothetical protein
MTRDPGASDVGGANRGSLPSAAAAENTASSPEASVEKASMRGGNMAAPPLVFILLRNSDAIDRAAGQSN